MRLREEDSKTPRHKTKYRENQQYLPSFHDLAFVDFPVFQDAGEGK